ncbi:DUF3054 domain-containing protein [Nocardioides sp. GXZ039]|uniref:DUF3054 domain-containing protein n=1 Tax=Nocardioides sp. GXZ039 TaxID=3136018 RepID=UPI0030F3D396
MTVDAVLVIVFATIGRFSHEEGVTLGGVLETAWPFLVGLALAWTLLVWREARPRSLGSGAVVWLGTLVVGMVLRHLTDAGTATPFVIVATLTLALFLLGWRLVSITTTRRDGARASAAP